MSDWHKKTGGMAFPTLDSAGNGLSLREPGMTLRDYFAAKALPAVVGAIVPQEDHRWTPDNFAQEAYELADAMLAERDKQDSAAPEQPAQQSLASTLRRLDGYMANTGYDSGHPWRAEIAAALAAAGEAK